MKFRVGDEVISTARVAKGERGVVCAMCGDMHVLVKFYYCSSPVSKHTKNLKHAYPAYLRMDTGL